MLAACRQGREVDVAAVEAGTELLVHEVLGQGTTRRLDSLATAVRSADDWARYQALLRPLRPFPPVEFPQAMVLLMVQPALTSGYTLEFDRAERDSAGLAVYYVVNAPAADCFVSADTTAAFMAVVVRQVPDAVRFVPRRETVDCTFRRF